MKNALAVLFLFLSACTGVISASPPATVAADCVEGEATDPSANELRRAGTDGATTCH